MTYIILNNGQKIEEIFFKKRLKELKSKKWSLKNICELEVDHVLCELTFETISPLTCDYYFESELGSIDSANTYYNYLKK